MLTECLKKNLSTQSVFKRLRYYYLKDMIRKKVVRCFRLQFTVRKSNLMLCSK